MWRQALQRSGRWRVAGIGAWSRRGAGESRLSLILCRVGGSVPTRGGLFSVGGGEKGVFGGVVEGEGGFGAGQVVGDGGDVVVRAGSVVDNLRAFRQKRRYRAVDGSNGGDKKKHGKKGESLLLAVPVGTVVSYKSQIGGDSLIADLETPGQQAVVAKGGKGGRGNARFATSTNQAPQIAETGEAGGEQGI